MNKHKTYILVLAFVFIAAAGISLIAFFRDDLDFQAESSPTKIQVASRRKANLTAIEKANCLPTTAPLVINSIGLPDEAGPYDENNAPAPWIELYNKSDRPISLKGYRVQSGYPGKYRSIQKPAIYSDSDVTTYTEPHHCFLPPITIVAHSSLFLFADGKCWLPQELPLTLRENKDWQLGHDYQRTSTGFCLFTTNTGASITMSGTVLADGLYTLWLRGYAEEKSAHLSCQIDDNPPASFILKPQKGYDLIPLGKPIHLAVGEHTVRLVSQGGKTIFSGLFFNHSETPTTSFHLNFSLLPEGDTIAIYPPHGLPLDYVTYPAIRPGQTYLRRDGQFELTTNKPGNLPVTPQPEFSLESGFITTPTNILITCPTTASGTTISVTFDGTMPQETKNKLITTPPTCGWSPPPWQGGESKFYNQLTITNTCLISARAFAPGHWPSRTVTKVYWAEPPPQIPVLWVVVDPGDLYSSDRGILKNRQARGHFSDRPASAHLLFPDGRIKECPVELRLQGRISRATIPNFFNRSFRLICQPSATPNNFGTVFNEPGPTNLTKIIARANNVIYHPFGLEAIRRLGFIAPRYRHCLLQINNTPFGISFLLDDPTDPEYIQQTFGHTDNLDMLQRHSLGRAKFHGSWKEYRLFWEAIDLNILTNLTPAFVAQELDLDYFTRWVIALYYLGLNDNDQGWLVLDKSKSNPRWEFINWDFDDVLYAFRNDKPDELIDIAGCRGKVFYSLMKDKKYRQYFRKKLQEMLSHELPNKEMLSYLEKVRREVLSYAAWECAGIQNQNPQISYLQRLRPQDVEGEYAKQIATIERYLDAASNILWKTIGTAEETEH